MVAHLQLLQGCLEHRGNCISYQAKRAHVPDLKDSILPQHYLLGEHREGDEEWAGIGFSHFDLVFVLFFTVEE